MLNRVILQGRLCADPQLRQTPNGIPVVSLRLAVQRDFGGQNGEQKTDFISVVAWRHTAEFISRYFHKGEMMLLEGALQTREYEDKDGNKRTAVEVVAQRAQFGEHKQQQGQDFAQEARDLSIDSADLPF